MPSTLILVSSYKGGTGKSTTSRLLTDHYRQRGLTTAAFDGNVETSSFAHCYATKDSGGGIAEMQNPLEGCAILSVRNKDQRDSLIELAEIGADRIIIDLPGGAVDDIEEILGNGKRFVSAFTDRKVRVVIAIPISRLDDSCSGVIDTILAFGEEPNYVVVKNRVFGRLEQFDAFDKKPDSRYQVVPAQYLSKVNGEIAAIPELDRDTFTRMSDNHLTIARALDSDKMTSTDKLRIKYWREEFAEDIKGTGLAAMVVPA